MVLDKLEQASGLSIRSIRVDGGVANNKALMQKLSNLLGKDLYLSEVEELSALGALAVVTGVPFQQEYHHVISKYDDAELKRYFKWKNKMQEEFE